MSRRLLFASAIAWTGAWTFVAAPMAVAEEREDGGAAPAGTWTNAGGSPARTGQTLTSPVLGAVRRAWEIALDGPIEGEPLVDEDLAIVPVRQSDAVRALVLVRISDGKVLGKKTFRTPAPLDASLWNGTVVVRADLARIEAHRLVGSTLNRFWLAETLGPAHSIVVHGTEVYVRAGDGLERWDVGVPKRRWRVGGGVRGTLALRGDWLYAVQYRDAEASLVAHDRTTGAFAWSAGIGHHDGVIPSETAPIGIHVFDRHILVRHALPVPTVSGRAADATVLRRTEPAGFLADGLWNMRSEPVAWDAGWAAVLDLHGEGERLVCQATGQQGVYPLASATSRPEWLQAGRLGSVAADVAYLGANAIDTTTSEIVWTTTHVTVLRPIPVRNGMLVAPARDRLAALLDSTTSRGTPWVSSEAATKPVPAGTPAAEASRAALRDGSIERGAFWIDTTGSAAVAGEGKARTSIPLGDVLALCDGTGRLVVAAAGEDGVRGLLALREQEIAQQYAKLAAEAAQAKDADLTGRLLAEAWRRGAEGPHLQRAETALKDMLRRAKAPEPKAGAAEAIAAKERQIRGQLAGWFFARLETLPPDAPQPLVFDVLRAILRHDPAHAGAVARVRALVPAGMTPPEPFAGFEWLEFAEAARECPVEVLAPPKPDDPELSNAQRLYGSLLHTWRADVAAVRSERMLVVSPLARPGSIARCISMGELVCTTLEGFFSSGTRRRATNFPMLLLLHETREEFRKAAAQTGSSTGEWADGYYSPDDEMSRMYLPSNDAEFRRVRSVFAHELTHQWMKERCPLFGASDRRDATKPGYWLVEGFASMVEALRYDLRDRRAEFDPRASYLGTVAGAPPRLLLTWPKLLAVSHVEFGKLSREPELDYPEPSRLGLQRRASVMNFFYDQSAATCAYLFYGDEGRLRDRFIEYIGAYYRGECPPVKDAFDMDAATLGEKVVEFARASIAR